MPSQGPQSPAQALGVRMDESVRGGEQEMVGSPKTQTKSCCLGCVGAVLGQAVPGGSWHADCGFWVPPSEGVRLDSLMVVVPSAQICPHQADHTTTKGSVDTNAFNPHQNTVSISQTRN